MLNNFAGHIFRIALLAALLPAIRTTPATAQMVVYATDFSVGLYSTISTEAPFSVNLNIGSTCSDAVFRSYGDKVYAIGRFGCDFIQIIDPSLGFQTIGQFSTGNGTNPHDIAFQSATKAYISLYEKDFILIMNPQTGQHLGQISLATFSDSDGVPEADGMLVRDNKLFVALQRLDRPAGLVANNDSYIAVIDCVTDQIIDVDANMPGDQAIVLTGRNPFTPLRWDNARKRIYVGEVGRFQVLDGGIEWINPQTLAAEGFVITESALGGDLNAIAHLADCTGYAIINDASFITELVRYDLCSGLLLENCFSSNGFTLADLEVDASGAVWVADRDLLMPGLRRIASQTCLETTTSPISVLLPPQDIVMLASDTPTDIARDNLPMAVSLLTNYPDPFNPMTTIQLRTPGEIATRIDIIDVRGRVVRNLWRGHTRSNRVELVWNGRNNQNRPLPSGAYFIRAKNSLGASVEPMRLIR